jgi:hypothetical protein
MLPHFASETLAELSFPSIDAVFNGNDEAEQGLVERNRALLVQLLWPSKPLALASCSPIPKIYIPVALFLENDTHVAQVMSRFVGSNYCDDVHSLLQGWRLSKGLGGRCWVATAESNLSPRRVTSEERS